MMIRSAILALVALVALIAAPAARGVAQEARPTVAVVLFAADVGAQRAEYEGLNKALADFLGRELSANPGVSIVERADVQRAIDARRLPAGAPVTREAAIAMARSLGARKIVVGEFTPDGRGNVRIDARTLDVASGAVEYTDRVQDRADSVVPLVGRLAQRLYGSLGVAGTRPASAGPALAMRAAIAYGRALDAADRGERARAAELYGTVLKDYPDYEPARRGLAKLKPGA